VVIGLFPELLAAGGIQRVGQHTGAVVAAFAQRHGMAYRFFSLNDPPGLHRIRVAETDFVVSGFERAKLRFAVAALRASRKNALLVLAAHAHLAPVAWAMKVRSPGLHALVLTHGIEVGMPLAQVRRWALRRADLVVAPSNDTARRLETQQGLRREKIRRLPWGLDPQFKALATNPGANHLPAGFPSGRIVLTVGRWAATEGYKGVDTLIAALPRLLPAVPDLYLIAVGEGDDRSRLEQLAAEKGVVARVLFLSGLTLEELAACYRRCDVFALPSRGEGFGVVFLEAMAHGKPVVGGAHGGTPDIIEDGVTGLLVPHGDTERLSGALKKLLTDQSLRQQMGLRARERVSSMYLFEHFAARLDGLLKQLCVS
jgi:glycosyltransferase involved in cell wall biosynthesis